MSNPFGMTTDDGDVTRDKRYVVVSALYMRERVVGSFLFGIFYYSREYDVKPEGAWGLVGRQKVESSRSRRIVDNSRKRILTGESRGLILYLLRGCKSFRRNRDPDDPSGLPGFPV